MHALLITSVIWSAGLCVKGFILLYKLVYLDSDILAIKESMELKPMILFVVEIFASEILGFVTVLRFSFIKVFCFYDNDPSYVIEKNVEY